MIFTYGIIVYSLVLHSRYPHGRLRRQWGFQILNNKQKIWEIYTMACQISAESVWHLKHNRGKLFFVFFFCSRPALGSVSGGNQQICLATKGRSFCEEIREKPFKTSESDQVEKVGFILFLCPAPVPFFAIQPLVLTSKKARGWVRQKDLNPLAKKIKNKSKMLTRFFSCLSSSHAE